MVTMSLMHARALRPLMRCAYTVIQSLDPVQASSDGLRVK